MILIFIYLFRPRWVLVAAHEIFVAACVWDIVPRPGIEPGPPALGVRSLTHWTTREVPVILIFRPQGLGGLQTRKCGPQPLESLALAS